MQHRLVILRLLLPGDLQAAELILRAMRPPAGPSGQRCSELASIRPESFDGTADPATVSVEPACTKNGDQAIQPVPANLAAYLRRHSARILPGDPMFPLPKDWGVEMLRADLAAAAIA